MIKAFNIAHLRKENPRFVFNDQTAIDTVLPYQIVKQIASISLKVETNLEGKFEIRQLGSDGPLNSLFLFNTSLQEEAISLLSTFTQNI
jgi:hypothetical protein